VNIDPCLFFVRFAASFFVSSAAGLHGLFSSSGSVLLPGSGRISRGLPPRIWDDFRSTIPFLFSPSPTFLLLTQPLIPLAGVKILLCSFEMTFMLVARLFPRRAILFFFLLPLVDGLYYPPNSLVSGKKYSLVFFFCFPGCPFLFFPFFRLGFVECESFCMIQFLPNFLSADITAANNYGLPKGGAFCFF